jgi:hypothetical protein
VGATPVITSSYITANFTSTALERALLPSYFRRVWDQLTIVSACDRKHVGISNLLMGCFVLLPPCRVIQNNGLHQNRSAVGQRKVLVSSKLIDNSQIIWLSELSE